MAFVVIKFCGRGWVSYFCCMATNAIQITDDEVLTCVYRTTANAALQRGDGAHVATVDNVLLLGQFLKEGKLLLNSALGRYYAGDLRYVVPSEWAGSADEIKNLSVAFLANYVTAKWLELYSTGERYIVVANEALNEVKLILSKRNKPS